MIIMLSTHIVYILLHILFFLPLIGSEFNLISQ